MRSALGGTFFAVTVLTDVTTDRVITKEETFGPVAPLYRFKTDDEAIKMANDTEFGLAATSAASGASPRALNTASSASTRASSPPRSRRLAA